MNSLKSEPKKKTKTTAKPAAGAPRPGNGKPRYIGVDLHKATATFHILSHDGKTLQTGCFEVTPKAIKRFAAEYLLPTDHLAVEVTSNTWAFVRLIRPRVAKIVVSNPVKTKAIAEANVKTDKVDAFVLAQLLRCDYLPSVWVPTPAVEDNRALAARRSALVSQRTAIRNRIHSMLARRLVVIPAGGLFSVKGLAWLEKLEVDPFDRTLIDADLRLLEAIDRQSATIDDMIVTESYDDPDVQLLMTLPGVDYTTAHAIKATLADVGRSPKPTRRPVTWGSSPASSNRLANATTDRSPRQAPARRDGSWFRPRRASADTQDRWERSFASLRSGRIATWRSWRPPEKWSRSPGTCSRIKNLTGMPHLDQPTRNSPRCECATGKKRKTGNPKGSKRVTKLGTGQSRTTPSLDDVYVRQGLPSRQPLADGEKRMIRESGTEQYVASLDKEKIVRKK